MRLDHKRAHTHCTLTLTLSCPSSASSGVSPRSSEMRGYGSIHTNTHATAYRIRRQLVKVVCGFGYARSNKTGFARCRRQERYTDRGLVSVPSAGVLQDQTDARQTTPGLRVGEKSAEERGINYQTTLSYTVFELCVCGCVDPGGGQQG